MDTDMDKLENVYGSYDGLSIHLAIKDAHEYMALVYSDTLNNSRDYRKRIKFYNEYLAGLKRYVKIKDSEENEKTINEVASILTDYTQDEIGFGRMPMDETLERIKNNYNSYKPNLYMVESGARQWQ